MNKLFFFIVVAVFFTLIGCNTKTVNVSAPIEKKSMVIVSSKSEDVTSAASGQEVDITYSLVGTGIKEYEADLSAPMGGLGNILEGMSIEPSQSKVHIFFKEPVDSAVICRIRGRIKPRSENPHIINPGCIGFMLRVSVNGDEHSELGKQFKICYQ